MVLDGVHINKSGRVGRRAKGGVPTKTGRMKQGMTNVVMFILVPQLWLRKRLDVMWEAKWWEWKLPGLVGREMARSK